MKTQFMLFVLLCSLLNLGYGQFSINAAYTVAPCDHDGVVAVTTVGGTAPFTYTWTDVNSGIQQITTVDTLGNVSGGEFFYVQVTDSANLVASDSLPQNLPIPIQFGGASPAHCPANNDGVIYISVLTGSYTFSWYQNGSYFTTTNSGILQNLAPNVYDVEIISAAGCRIFWHEYAGIPITIGSIGNYPINLSTIAANCLDGTATVAPTGAIAPYTYSWYDNSTQTWLNSTNDSVSNLIANHSYKVFISDSTGCPVQQTFFMQAATTINIQSQISPENCMNADGSIMAIPTNGVAPYTYNWTGGQTTQTITGLSTGNYHCIVTDMNSCIGSIWFSVPNISPVAVTYTVVPSNSCVVPNGQANLSATGGTPPYSYSWANGQTTATVTGLGVGTHHFEVMDAAGCKFIGDVVVPYANPMTLSIATTPDTCGTSVGTATTNLTGGIAPFMYSWNTLATTPSISQVPAANYTCTVVDANGCSLTKTGYVNYFSLINIALTITNAVCPTTPNGAISSTVTGGQAPYTYTWNIGSNNTSINNLVSGNYYLYVTDANGCHASKLGYVGSGNGINCFGTIMGVVYEDWNGNCMKDAGENGIPNTQVSCSGVGSTFTNASGAYSFQVLPGTYTIQHYPTLYHYASCPALGSTSVTVNAGMVVVANFADSTAVAQDLITHLYSLGSPILGTIYSQIVVSENRGNITIASPEVHYVYDSQLPFVSSNPVPNSTIYAPNELLYYLPSLVPHATHSIVSSFNVSNNIPLNTILTYSDTLLPIIGDVTWWDNDYFVQPTVMGAFDPNYKEVFPRGIGQTGDITVDDSILSYVIHFQNTGNALAHTVVLKDTLDSDLDFTTINMGYSTHTYTAKITATGVLEITFENIELPDSGSDMAGSMGLVAYEIKPKKNLPLGTQFTNDADIYFDFNYPIHTNMTINTLTEPLAVKYPVGIEKPLKVFPNPTQGLAHIESTELTPIQYQLRNVLGQVLLAGELSPEKEIHLSSFPTGLYYLLFFEEGNLIQTEKMMIER